MVAAIITIILNISQRLIFYNKKAWNIATDVVAYNSHYPSNEHPQMTFTLIDGYCIIKNVGNAVG